MPKPHVYELVASDLAGWIDSTARSLANDMRGGRRAPFAAPLSEAEKLRHYEAQTHHPDGSPHVAGRLALMNRVGVKDYARILLAVGKARAARVEPGAAPDEGESE